MVRRFSFLILVWPIAVSAAPLYVTHARIDNAPAPSVRTGGLVLKAVIDDTAANTLPASVLTNSVAINVTDAASFNVNVSLANCKRAGSGIRCVAGPTRLKLKRTAQSSVYRLRLSVRQLGSQSTGLTRPVSPVRVTIREEGATDRIDVISDCEPIGTTRLGCRDKDRPNLIYIVSDDQRWDTLQYMPQTLALLADQGVTFTNAFVTTPLCGPSRASMLNGQYARHHGVLTNAGEHGGAPAFVGPDASTLATWLHDAGYRTGMYGKYMVGYSALCPPYRSPCYRPPGWDEWHVFLQQAYYNYQLDENETINSFGSAEADYSTDVLTAKAVDFIRQADGQPFFLHLGYHAPHGDRPFPAAAPRHAGTFRGFPPFGPPLLPPWRPPGYDEDDMSDKPPWMATLPRATDQIGIFLWGTFAETYRLLQLEASLAIDDGIAAIVAALEETDQAENTAIIFVSDNGFFWGEHRLYAGKDYPYIESLRVPLVVRYPRMVPTARINDHLLLNIDIAPTLAALGKTEPSTPVDGANAVPLLLGDATGWRNDFLFEWWGFSGEALQDYQGVCSPDWQYISYPAIGQSELYDLLNDPYELQSRAGDTNYQDIVTAQQQRLSELLAP